MKRRDTKSEKVLRALQRLSQAQLHSVVYIVGWGIKEGSDGSWIINAKGQETDLVALSRKLIRERREYLAFC